MKLLFLLALPVALYAQNPNPCQQIRNQAKSGQVLSAAANGATPPCQWVTGGGGGSGTVTNIATTSPISGGPITTTGTISCPTCVVGPASVTSGHIATFNGTTGKLIQDGGAPATGTVTSVVIAGTSNQVNVAGTCTITTSGTCTVSLPAGVILGTDNSAAGTLQLANGSANAHTIWSSGATTTNTIAGFTSVPTTGHAVTCTSSGTTCTLTDGGAPGNSISQGTCASLPMSSGASGNMYQATDQGEPYHFISTGSVWNAYWMSQSVTVPPPVASLTWRNQGTSTYSTVANCSSTFTGANNASFNYRALTLAAPGSTPYSFTLRFRTINGNPYVNSFTFGLNVTDGTKYRTCEMLYQATTLGARMEHLNSTTSDATTVGSLTGLINNNQTTVQVLKYVDDGANATCSYSQDGGVTYAQVAQETRTTFVTATSVGFGGVAVGTGRDIPITIWDFTQGTN